MFQLGFINNIPILKNISDGANDILNIANFVNKYVLHPYNIWIQIYSMSYPIVIFLGGISIILWSMGWKKGFKFAGWTITGYAIIRIIGI